MFLILIYFSTLWRCEKHPNSVHTKEVGRNSNPWPVSALRYRLGQRNPESTGTGKASVTGEASSSLRLTTTRFLLLESNAALWIWPPVSAYDHLKCQFLPIILLVPFCLCSDCLTLDTPCQPRAEFKVVGKHTCGPHPMNKTRTHSPSPASRSPERANFPCAAF